MLSSRPAPPSNPPDSDPRSMHTYSRARVQRSERGGHAPAVVERPPNASSTLHDHVPSELLSELAHSRARLPQRSTSSTRIPTLSSATSRVRSPATSSSQSNATSPPDPGSMPTLPSPHNLAQRTPKAGSARSSTVSPIPTPRTSPFSPRGRESERAYVPLAKSMMANSTVEGTRDPVRGAWDVRHSSLRSAGFGTSDSPTEDAVHPPEGIPPEGSQLGQMAKKYTSGALPSSINVPRTGDERGRASAVQAISLSGSAATRPSTASYESTSQSDIPTAQQPETPSPLVKSYEEGLIARPSEHLAGGQAAEVKPFFTMNPKCDLSSYVPDTDESEWIADDTAGGHENPYRHTMIPVQMPPYSSTADAQSIPPRLPEGAASRPHTCDPVTVESSPSLSINHSPRPPSSIPRPPAPSVEQSRNVLCALPHQQIQSVALPTSNGSGSSLHVVESFSHSPHRSSSPALDDPQKHPNRHTSHARSRGVGIVGDTMEQPNSQIDDGVPHGTAVSDDPGLVGSSENPSHTQASPNVPPTAQTAAGSHQPTTDASDGGNPWDQHFLESFQREAFSALSSQQAPGGMAPAGTFWRADYVQVHGFTPGPPQAQDDTPPPVAVSSPPAKNNASPVSPPLPPSFPKPPEAVSYPESRDRVPSGAVATPREHSLHLERETNYPTLTKREELYCYSVSFVALGDLNEHDADADPIQHSDPGGPSWPQISRLGPGPLLLQTHSLPPTMSQDDPSLIAPLMQRTPSPCSRFPEGDHPDEPHVEYTAAPVWLPVEGQVDVDAACQDAMVTANGLCNAIGYLQQAMLKEREETAAEMGRLRAEAAAAHELRRERDELEARCTALESKLSEVHAQFERMIHMF